MKTPNTMNPEPSLYTLERTGSVPFQSPAKPAKLLRILGPASIAYLCQTLDALLATHLTSFSQAFQWLNQWDSIWYKNATKFGITLSLPEDSDRAGLQTVAWFPGYSLFAKLFFYFGDVDEATAILLAAHLACFGFWVYFFLIATRLKWSLQTQFCLTVLVLSYPSAFYMVCGYSESFFLFLSLGYCYWVSANSRWSGVLAALHGFWMSATRIVGIPLSLVPLLSDLHRRLSHRILIAGISTLGGFGYFLYCQVKFKEWDIYMRLQKMHWNVTPDYFAFFRPSTFSFHITNFGWSDTISQNATTVVLVLLFISSAFAGIRKKGRDTFSLTLLGCAWISLYVNVSGLATRGLISMVRYTFPVYVFCLLSLAMGFTLDPPRWAETVTAKRAFLGFTVIFCALSFILEQMLLKRFVELNWVS